MRRTATVLAVAFLVAGCSGKSSPPVASTPESATASPTATGAGPQWVMYHGTPDHAGDATSMPAVLNRVLDAVTKITAIRLPLISGKAYHG